MPTPLSVSVIIPTYNRKDLLWEALHSIAQQTYPRDRFEVIVVDDGSTDGTAAVAEQAFPFKLRYYQQGNQGDAAARNFGVQQSQADILVFLDDDILLEPSYLACLVQTHGSRENRIVAGTCRLRPAKTSPFLQSLIRSPALDDSPPGTDLPYRDVCSNNMSLRRKAYFQIGMMQGLDFPGSSMWCDLDFCYRAYLQGFEFCLSAEAVCWHRDYAAANLDTYKKRMKTAAFRAVVLFQRYPELLAQIPMFYDKTPVTWSHDSPQLIARKLARAMASSRLALWSMEEIAHAMEQHYPTSRLLQALYRYIVGGYVFWGYREGLSEFGPVPSVGSF